MANRSSRLNMVLSLLAFLTFMIVLLASVGSGVGSVEALIWLVLVAVGVALIVRRHRSARSAAA